MGWWCSEIVDESGNPKGMRIVLQERGIDTTKMKASEMRVKLKTFPDFKQQHTILQEYIRTTERHLLSQIPL